MKNLLLIFLLANILYFVWAAFRGDEPEPGVAVVEESDLGPPLNVTTDDESVASVGAVLGSGEPSALEAVAGRSCVTLGPFEVPSEANSAVLENNRDGMRAAQRSAAVQRFIGHWVQIRNVTDIATANRTIAELAEGGLTDAYFVETENMISLGLFGEVTGAQKIEAQAKELGLPAEILPRTTDDTVFYVDIELPPGRGAGAIVERHGEDMVALREQATCPQ